MIPTTMSEKLERMQRQALRIIFGWDVNVGEIMKIKDISTLRERREQAMLNFALKNEHTGNFGKRWFHPTPHETRQVRPTTRDKYVVPFCRTDRQKSNPLVKLTTILNNHYKQ